MNDKLSRDFEKCFSDDYLNPVDQEYFRLLRLILEDGRVKKNRTGIDTIGVFGAQAKFNVNMDAFPILTTKKVWFKGVVHELLWFIKGDTNIKYLVDNDVHIWDEWAYKKYCDITRVNAPGWWDKWMKDNGDNTLSMYTKEEFIQKIRECPTPLFGEHFTEENFKQAEFAVRWGELGQGTYGGMWRAFPYHDGSEDESHVDQLQKVIDKLKSNPDDRRMIVSAWHPYWVDHCALPPCHCMFHFNTEELTLEERLHIFSKGWDVIEARKQWASGSIKIDEHEALDEHCIPRRKVNLLLYQRSCDTFLGVPFNITSYALLLAMVAHCVGMEPGVFTHTYGDLHIYQNHREQIDLQLSRPHRILPSLWLNPNIKNLVDFKFEDIKLIGYDPHPAIKGEVAV
jgi:thymidylate synthase